MAATTQEKVASLIDSAKFAGDMPSKLDHLRQLKEDWFMEEDAFSLSEFLHYLFDLHTDRFSPVRKFVVAMIGEIGLKHVELLPEIAPVLTTVLKDTTPAVARQAISCGINLFRHVLEKVALQGLYSSELDESLESAWAWMLKFKDHMYSVAFQPGSDSIRLLALKFVEAIVVLYTPDPSGSSEPPHPQAFEGNLIEFNVAWLRGGHPVLSVRDLSVEASQSLALLLDQLRFPTIRSLSCPMIIVLINSLATIAKRRPSFYGRILPVLLGLDPPSSNIKGVHVSGARHALKNAFLSCLNCTLPGAVPWRERLVDALREMKAGDQEVATLGQVYKIKGSSDETKENILIKEEKSMVRASNAVHSSTGTKRLAVPGQCDFVEDAELSGKRTRLDASASEGSSEGPKRDRSLFQDDITSVQTASSRGDGDTGPVQQLSAMFGALVAQGEKAVGSLEILMSSISADLLAEVVMTNMRYLPSSLPQAEDNDDPFLKMNSEGSDAKVKHSPSIFIDILSLSNALPKMSSLLEALRSRAENVARPQVEEECRIKKPQVKEECHAVASTLAATNAVSVAVSEIPDVGNLVGEIPGLGSVSLHHGSKETHTSCLAPTKLEGAIQEKVTSPGKRSILNVHPSISTDKSEELSQSIFADSSSIISSTATSVVASNQFVLPKMSAPVVNLHDEEKDQVQKLVFIRIVDAYKQVAAAGGLHARSSLLVNLAVEFPLELDPWAFLHEHILSDYTNHEGHELTLRVLYRLFGEAEVEHDFFSSTTATSVYETFILKVAETLRDSFAASDKSLSRLLGEAPYLPKSVFSMLESLCSSGKCDKDEESHSGDRVTQGLSTVWNLILLRPPLREACLKIALQSAVHRLEEVRMKAIRLVANKLYPLPYIAQRIEDFAKEMLFSVINSVDGSEKADVNGSLYSESHKDTDMVKTSAEHPLASSSGKDVSDHHQSSTSPSISSYSISEAQRCMSLYFALCTKKHSMLREIFLAYNSASKDVKQAVHRHIPLLVRTMGSSLDLLDIMSDPPSGSEGLLMQVLHTLTDGAIPSPELISTVKKLYDSKVKDVEILIPVLPYLPKDEVMQVFSHFINLPSENFQVALARILQGSSHSGPVLTPAEVLIAIHGIDPERDGIPLKKVTDACNACFEQRQIFTQQVLAKVLNQLVEQIPLPLLFMRTVLQAIGAFPGLVEFVMEILSRLVSKQIWKSPKLWVGFLKCAQLTQPTSFSVLLQLPPAQLENALNRSTALKAPLVAHASQPKVRSSLPRSVLVVLGIATDSQSSSHAQTSKGLTADASGKEGAMETNRGSSTAS